MIFLPVGAFVHLLRETLEQDPAAGVLVLTGAGDAWTAGMDLKDYFRATDKATAVERARVYRLNAAWQWRGHDLRPVLRSAASDAELFNRMAGVQLAHVPYKGAAPAVILAIGCAGALVLVELRQPAFAVGTLGLVGKQHRVAVKGNTDLVGEPIVQAHAGLGGDIGRANADIAGDTMISTNY